MTISIVQEILKNIEKKKQQYCVYRRFKILESNQKIKDKEILTIEYGKNSKRK